MLKEAKETKDKIINEAKEQAKAEAGKIIVDANMAIDVQYQDNTVNRYEREIDEALTLIWHVVIPRQLICAW